MKLGRKGFMLGEVVVISVVVATVLVTLYTGLNNVVSAYETRNRYYDIDSLFIATEVNEVLLRKSPTTIQTNDVINLSTNVDVTSFINFYEDQVEDSINLYLTPYDKDKMLSINQSINSTFLEYLNYLSGNLDFGEDYDYMIIVERIENNNDDDCYYYALKLKY